MQPSLKYLLEAVHRTVYPAQDYDYNPNLERWSTQGVLLINSALTCEINKPGTHYDIWQPFIVYLVDILNATHPGLIWVLMGKKAEELSELINEKTQTIITTSHPASAAYSGEKEWNCRDCFNIINETITANNGPHFTIKW